MYENPRCQWWFPNNIIYSWISTTCTIAVIYTGRPQVQLVFEYTTDSICRVYNRIDRDLSINKRYVTVEITWSRGVLERRGGDKWENWRSGCWLVDEQNMPCRKGGMSHKCGRTKSNYYPLLSATTACTPVFSYSLDCRQEMSAKLAWVWQTSYSI